MSDVARFVLPEAPEDDENARLLFVDREAELAQARAQVAAVRRNDLRRPMAIAGQARVGKSHVLKALEMAVRQDFSAVVWVRVSTGLSDGRAILREALNQVYVALVNASLVQGLGPPAGPGVLFPLERILKEYSEAIAGTAVELSLDQVRAVTHTISRSASLSAKLPFILAGLGTPELSAEIQVGRERAQMASRSRQVKVHSFAEAMLTDLIGMAHVLIREHAKDWTTLLILDDFDLLKRADDGSFDPDPILQALFNLAQLDGFHVLTTVREDTFSRHEKTFHLVTYVTPFRDAAPLHEIYHRHVNLYYDGEDPFAGGFVAEAAQRCEGRVGVFLQKLRDAFMFAGPRLAQLSLQTWMWEIWADLRRSDPRAAEALLVAARDEGGNLRAEDIQLIRRSAAMRYVLENYTSIDALSVEPVLLSILRETEPA